MTEIASLAVDMDHADWRKLSERTIPSRGGICRSVNFTYHVGTAGKVRVIRSGNDRDVEPFGKA